MTRLGLLVVAVVACNGGEMGEDAALEADAGTIATDARGPDAPPGGLDGMWRVTWQCVAGCGGSPAEPALVYSGLLDVSGFDLRWHDETCADCVRDHSGSVVNEHCLDIAAGDEGNHTREAFRICETGGQAEASITWRSRFAATTTRWNVTGSR